MKKSDSAQFSKALLGLAEVLGAEISKTKISLYFEALSEYPIDAVESAIAASVKANKFFPKPVELIELISGKAQDKSLLAWMQVTKAIDDFGAYKSVRFSDAVIHSCIEQMGGWSDLCNTAEEEMTWKQKEFERLYLALMSRPEHPAYLAGIFEISNRANGYAAHVKGPILIGFEGKKQIEGAATERDEEASVKSLLEQVGMKDIE